MPIGVNSASTCSRPTAAISMSVAVLSLIEIILPAVSRTVTSVPDGRSCMVPPGIDLRSSVMVSF